ncbi:MAG: hypothetical protein MUP70_12220 [Candidatus Aminicenantes bacterium]|nr:hypothetical protein [Candidatus Aminicenantes bacterium]
MDSQAFLYLGVQPGIGGWDVVTEEEGEDEGGGFFSWLAASAFTLAAVSMVGTILNIVDDIVSGKPLIVIYH